ncbi:MAG: hypothetical protein M3O71_27885 [Bacteroidota bacterium]|nr:hypothetical protein [Bacteroidota bacterium]
MKNENDDLTDRLLSDDTEENLRMENELLRLKLRAEFGSELHDTGNLPPDIENEFLKYVFAAEQNHAKLKAR